MSLQLVGLLGLLVLIVLIFARVPVAVALGLVGFVGYGLVNGWAGAMHVVGSVPFDVASQYDLSQLPLFLLMGDIAVRSGMSERLYYASRTIFGGLKGSEAYATIGASAGLGSVSGSSLATAAMMARISLPAMEKSGYDHRLSVGSVAAGGTLGILIPPSIALVVYGMIAQQSVPRLYAASMIPGVLLTLFYCFVIFGLVRLDPHVAPDEAKRMPMLSRFKALGQVWEIALLFAVVIGGIYTGALTATESAAVGAAGAWFLGVISRTLTWRATVEAFFETIRTSAMLFVILFCANIFTYFVVLTNIPDLLLGVMQSLKVGPVLLMILLALICVLLGAVLEAFGMLLIAVPIFTPLVIKSGFDPVWFGVFLVIIIEMGLIAPPLGLNIFVIQDQLRNVPITKLYKSVLPFLLAPIALTVLMIAWPDVAMWLPRMLFD